MKYKDIQNTFIKIANLDTHVIEKVFDLNIDEDELRNNNLKSIMEDLIFSSPEERALRHYFEINSYFYLEQGLKKAKVKKKFKTKR